MSERKNYLAAVRTFETTCRENELTGTFWANEYPLRLTIRPYTGVGSQMSLLENMETRGISPNATVTMIYTPDKVEIKISDKFAISEALLSTFTKNFKKLCSTWQELLYAEIHASGGVNMEDLKSIDSEVREEI